MFLLSGSHGTYSSLPGKNECLFLVWFYLVSGLLCLVMLFTLILKATCPQKCLFCVDVGLGHLLDKVNRLRSSSHRTFCNSFPQSFSVFFLQVAVGKSPLHPPLPPRLGSWCAGEMPGGFAVGVRRAGMPPSAAAGYPGQSWAGWGGLPAGVQPVQPGMLPARCEVVGLRSARGVLVVQHHTTSPHGTALRNRSAVMPSANGELGRRQKLFRARLCF